jgi:alpha-beta hydrolase superfamily lysophospholipase
MTTLQSSTVAGTRGRIALHEWRESGVEPRYLVLLVHGYGEHAGRYRHVAERLVAHGADVYAPDHLGHGESEGERALIPDGDDIVTDLYVVAERARAEHPGLPLVLLGHSMGGVLAARYVQRHEREVAALVLSAPVIGGNPGFEALLAMDPIPDVPIDPGMLSRDPDVGVAYAADPLVWHGPFKRQTLETMFELIGKIADGRRLELPTLWIHGELDQLAPLELTRAAIERVGGRRLEERIYPGAQHEVLNEINQDEVLADVTAFLDRVLGGAS